MYGRNQHNIVIILLLKIIKGEKEKNEEGRETTNQVLFPPKKNAKAPKQHDSLSPESMFALQRVCRTWSSDSCPVSGKNALRARKLLRKDAPGGFSDLNWKCEVKEHHSHSWLLCTAVLKAQRHWGSQVSEPGLAFWWWLLPLQWEAEIVDQQQCFFFLMSDHTPPHVGSWFLDQGSSLHSPCWKAES